MKYEFKMRVIYKDTDGMGVVHHSNYYNFYELARTELFRSEGISYKMIESRGLAFPVIESHCRYFKPARYDDILTVEVTVGFIRNASLRFNYIIRNEKNEKIASGHTVHPIIDSNWSITEFPNDLRVIAEKYLQKE